MEAIPDFNERLLRSLFVTSLQPPLCPVNKSDAFNFKATHFNCNLIKNSLHAHQLLSNSLAKGIYKVCAKKANVLQTDLYSQKSFQRGNERHKMSHLYPILLPIAVSNSQLNADVLIKKQSIFSFTDLSRTHNVRIMRLQWIVYGV